MRNLGLALLVVILIFSLSSCSDSTDPAPLPTHIGTLSGVATDLGSGQPLPGTTVILVTEEFVVRQVKTTAADGSFFFEGLTTEPLLIYGIKENYRMAEAYSSLLSMPEGEAWTADLPMMEDADENLSYHITGQVTNATTEAPVAGAWIANIGLGEAGNSLRYLVENRGIFIAVSDEDGLYSLPAFPVSEFFGGPVIGLSAISVGCEGFLSKTFAGEGPNSAHEPYMPGGLLPAPADSTLVLDIALEPVGNGGLPSESTGTVRGIIVHNGQPQSGVLVNLTLMALADRDTVFDPNDKVLTHGSTVLSADDGSFEFQMQPGFYALRAGLLPDDGWCCSYGPPDLEVVAEEVTELGNISVGAAIAPISPVPGSVHTDAWPTLSWTPIEGAESYRVKAGFNSFRYVDWGTTVETEWSWPAEMPLPEETTLVRWTIYAVRTVEGTPTVFSWFEIPASFTMAVQE